MKRFSMAMTWLALAGLMTTVSCRKPVVGFTNGEARTVTVSAVTESGGGSKTAIDGLYVKWSENDKISMNGSVLELTEGAGSTMGRFAGEVTGGGPYYIGYPADNTTCAGATVKLSIQAEWTYNVEKQEVPMVAYAASVDDDVYFRNAVNMLKLQLKGDGTNASKLKSIVLTSASSNLSGDINVTFNGGVPEFAAIADADRAGKTTMTVSFGEEGLQLKADEVKCVYIPLAKISGGDLTVRFNCANGKMEKKVTATSSFNAVNNMLDCGVVEVKAVPKFSVSETTTVEFAPGNLWYGIADGESTAAFHFEKNQWDYSAGEYHDYCYYWDPSDVSHFFWSKTATVTYAGSYKDNDASTDDVFFTNAPDFQVEGEDAGAWRTLSIAEWNYLLGYDPVKGQQTDTYGRPGAKNLCEWKGLDGGTHKGLVILPDGTENPSGVLGSITETSDLATHGAVFLPAAGYRGGSEVICVGSEGSYWSSTPGEDYEGGAYSMNFNSGRLYTYNDDRNYGEAVRLVR